MKPRPVRGTEHKLNVANTSHRPGADIISSSATNYSKDRTGREGFVPSPNAPRRARDTTWPNPHGAMLLDRDIPARNPPALGRESPRHGLGSPGLLRHPPRAPQLTLPAASTRLRPGGRPRPRSPPRAGATPEAGAGSGASSALRHRRRGHVAVATAPRIPPTRPGPAVGASHQYSLHLFFSFLKFSALPDHA